MEGVSDEAARQQFVGSGTTLLSLTNHISYAEVLWIVHRFAGEDTQSVDDRVDSNDTLAAARHDRPLVAGLAVGKSQCQHTQAHEDSTLGVAGGS